MKRLLLFFIILCSFSVVGCSDSNKFATVNRVKIVNESKVIKQMGVDLSKSIKEQLQKEGLDKDNTSAVYKKRFSELKQEQVKVIESKINNSIKAVMKQKQITAIFDRNIAFSKLDITEDVLNYLENNK